MAITKIGTPELFDFSATNTALQLPTGTTAQRPTSPSAGEWRFNTTEKYVEYYDGGAWRQIDTEELPNPDDFPSQNFNVNTYIGNGGTQTIDAKFNEAANFNGSSSLIALPESSVISQQNNFTLSFWVKPNGFVAFGTVLTLYSDYRNYVDIRTNGILGFDATGSQVNTPSSSITDGVWQHIAITKSSTAGTVIYVNGTAVVTDASDTGNASDFTSNSYPNTVGAYKLTGSASDFFPGSIDQVRIFNTVLPATGTASIATLYAETTTTAATLNFPVGAGCVAAYQLDGDASDVGGTYGGVTTDIGYTGLRFQPDLVWIKERSNASQHALFDSVRGNQYLLSPNQSIAEIDQSANPALESFDTNGFTVDQTNTDNYYVNRSSQTYVSWCFNAGTNAAATNNDGTIASTVKANTKAGFSIVKYTATGTTATVGHGLSSAPELILSKTTSAAYDWLVYAAPVGATKQMRLNANTAAATSGFMNNTAPTSSVYTVASGNNLNYANGDVNVAYCFTSITGYQKVGSYTGNNGVNTISTEITSGDGGVEPAFLLIKNTTAGSTNNWIMVDNKRSPANQRKQVLNANLPDAESTETVNINFLTNGFQLTNGNSAVNQNGDTYIYLAIAADKDTSVPTQANSFSPTTYTGTGGTNHNIYTPFAPDFTWIKSRSIASSHGLYDTIRGAEKWITSNGTNSTQSTPSALQQFNPNGFTLGNDSGQWGVNAASATYISWNWKAGGLPTINSDGDNTSIVSANQAAGFSIITYRGNGNNDSSVGHGLNSSPEMFIYKRTSSTGSWNIVHKDVNNYQAYLEFTTGNANNDSSMQSPTDSVIRFNTNSPSFNGLNQDWLIYAFHSVTGYQKVGSYPANGSTTGPIVYTTDDGTATGTGGFEPRFLLIKSADNASTNWIILDKARTPNNPMENDLKPNSQAVEQTGTGNNYPQATTSATGFQVNTTDSAVNGSGTYIYLAIA